MTDDEIDRLCKRLRKASESHYANVSKDQMEAGDWVDYGQYLATRKAIAAIRRAQAKSRKVKK